MQKPLAIQVGSRHAEKGTQHTGNIFQCSDICTRWLNPARNNLTWQQTYHLLYFQQFQVLLTLFSKSFSHFPQGTCLLSFPTQQFTLGEVYHQFCTPLPRSTTLKNTPRIKDCTWQTRVSLSLLLFFQKRRMHTSIGNAIETCKPKPKVWTSRLSHSLFIRHYYRSPCQFIFLCLLICLNSAGLLVSHQADNKATQFS